MPDIDYDDIDATDATDAGSSSGAGGFGDAPGGTGYVPNTAPSVEGSDYATQIALLATAQGVECPLTSSPVLGALGDFANLDAVALGTIDPDTLEGDTADRLVESAQTTARYVETAAGDAFAALSTIGDRVIPALAGVSHAQSQMSPSAALAATPQAPGTELDSATITAYLADAHHVFAQLWTADLAESPDAVAGTIGKSAPDGDDDDDDSARDFADDVARALTTPTGAAALPVSSAPAMPLGTHLSSGMPMSPMASPSLGMMPTMPMSGMPQPSGASFMPGPIAGGPGTPPASSRGTGITAADIRQMVNDARNRVRAENEARRAPSASDRPSSSSSSSTPRPTSTYTPRETIPSASDSGRDDAPRGRGTGAGPSSGRTVSGVGIDPAQVQGRPGSGAATGLTAQAPASGGAGGGQSQGMRGGMMPMGAMGAMGAMGQQAGAGGKGNTSAAERGLTTSDPTLTGAWASSIGINGAVINLSAAASADLGENITLAPKKAPTASPFGGASW